MVLDFFLFELFRWWSGIWRKKIWLSKPLLSAESIKIYARYFFEKTLFIRSDETEDRVIKDFSKRPLHWWFSNSTWLCGKILKIPYGRILQASGNNDVAVQHVSQYTTENNLMSFWILLFIFYKFETAVFLIRTLVATSSSSKACN